MTDSPKGLTAPAPLKRPLDPANMGQEAAALRGLVGMLNDPRITGAVVPPGESTAVETAAISPELPPPPAIAPPPPPVVEARVIDASKIFYTGRLKAGKDHIAGLTGAKNFGFSEPLYYLLEFFFGVKDKDKHGARKFLQYAGQVGRNVINEQYPLTPERAVFVQMVRTLSKKFPDTLRVDWSTYGFNNNIWLDAVNQRIDEHLASQPGARVSNTNVRFEHEFARLKEQGFRHYHVMCSKATWEARLKQAGLQANSPVVTDVSEQLAAALDRDVTQKISKQRTGKKLAVIWNDPAVPPPSPRLYTVNEFLALVGTPAETAPMAQPDLNTTGMIVED
jgi:hypothetical protein